MKILWFSGGKDSMACLYLLRHSLSEITVLFLNTGKYYPEHVATVEKARAMCPNWIEVTADRDAQWNANGLPADLVPIDWTRYGQQFSSRKQTTVQSYLQCCFENITAPLLAKSKELGATVIIKGQRTEDSHRSTAKNGDVVEGITYSHPIEDWTTAEVLAYLREQMGELPEHYALEHSSMDCYDCTAYAAHSHDRVAYMRERHPAMYADYAGKLSRLCAAINTPLEHYRLLAETVGQPCQQ